MLETVVSFEGTENLCKSFGLRARTAPPLFVNVKSRKRFVGVIESSRPMHLLIDGRVVSVRAIIYV